MLELAKINRVDVWRPEHDYGTSHCLMDIDIFPEQGNKNSPFMRIFMKEEGIIHNHIPKTINAYNDIFKNLCLNSFTESDLDLFSNKIIIGKGLILYRIDDHRYEIILSLNYKVEDHTKVKMNLQNYSLNVTNISHLLSFNFNEKYLLYNPSLKRFHIRLKNFMSELYEKDLKVNIISNDKMKKECGFKTRVNIPTMNNLNKQNLLRYLKR